MSWPPPCCHELIEKQQQLTTHQNWQNKSKPRSSSSWRISHLGKRQTKQHYSLSGGMCVMVPYVLVTTLLPCVSMRDRPKSATFATNPRSPMAAAGSALQIETAAAAAAAAASKGGEILQQHRLYSTTLPEAAAPCTAPETALPNGSSRVGTADRDSSSSSSSGRSALQQPPVPEHYAA
jgi:hypothetical protein